MRLTVPPELRKKGTNKFNVRWFTIEERLEEYWDRWWTEYMEEVRKVKKWQQGEVDLKPGDLVLVCDEDPNAKKGPIKWPLGVVLSLKKDAAGRIQTVGLRYRKSETSRGIRSLAPVPGFGDW